MLKRKAKRKIFITTFVLLILLSIYLIPSNITSNKSRNIVKYSKPRDISIYLVNESSQLTKVNFKVKNEEIFIKKFNPHAKVFISATNKMTEVTERNTKKLLKFQILTI